MSATPGESLGNFLADFYGKTGNLEAVNELLIWCASDDGLAHDAPAVQVDASSPNGAIEPTTASAQRYGAMLAAFSDWVINRLGRPPGWVPPPGIVDGRYTGPDVPQGTRDLTNYTATSLGFYPNETRDWARTWTAAHPS